MRVTTKKQYQARNAFTLIELLVVIAIIAILAAILFPVFGRARENGRRASCQSNLKQIALGIAQYSQDYDEKNPYSFIYDANGRSWWWQDTIQPYVKSYQVLVCPSHSQPFDYDVIRPAGTPNPLRVSYAANGIGDMYADQVRVLPSILNGVTATSIASYEEPATTIMISELATAYGYPDMNFFSVTDLGTYTPSAVDKRHLEGSNYLFCDGHVKWLRQTQRGMWSSKSD